VDDDQLIELSVKIDTSMLKWAEQYKTSGLAMSAVMLARMMLLCDSIGAGQDFRKLCFEVAGREIYEQDEVIH
jgi:hypothetical protein